MALNINQNGNVESRQATNKAQAPVSNARSAQIEQPLARSTNDTVMRDSVSLTQQAQDLNKMQNKLSSSSSFNQERVNSLKKAISEGKYSVDAEKLAQNMLNFEEELHSILG